MMTRKTNNIKFETKWLPNECLGASGRALGTAGARGPPGRLQKRSRRRQNRSRRPPGDENGTEHQLGDLIFRKKAPRSRHSAFLAQKINLASVGTGSAFNARAASITSDAKHQERSKNGKRNESTEPRGAAKQAWREQRE